MLERPAPPFINELLARADALTPGLQARLILVTAHRRENFGAPLEQICAGLRYLVERNPDVVICYPVHLNPNVRQVVFSALEDVDRVMLIEPTEYDTMVHLMNAAHIILTDSGGIQEEAPALGKPVLVLRTETERPEAIEAKSAKLIDPMRIASSKKLRDC